MSRGSPPSSSRMGRIPSSNAASTRFGRRWTSSSSSRTLLRRPSTAPDRQRQGPRIRREREQGNRSDERPVRRPGQSRHRAAEGRRRAPGQVRGDPSAGGRDRPAGSVSRRALAALAPTFPTVSGTIVRRTPLRKVLHPETRQLDHYLLEDRPTEPAQADWMLAAFLLLRREMLDELGGFDRASASTARTSTSATAHNAGGSAGTCRRPS